MVWAVRKNLGMANRPAWKQSRVLASRSARAAAVARARQGNKVARPRGNLTNRSPFPKTKAGVVLRYTSNKVLTIPNISSAGQVGGAAQRYFFRCNSIYDPDQAVGGHQPLGMDQWEAIYNHYEVTSAKISVVYNVRYDQATNNGIAITFGLGVISDTGSAKTVDEDMQMDSNYKWDRVGYYLTPTKTLTAFYDPYKWNNIDSKALPDSLTALMNTNPAEQQFFDVWASARNESGGVMAGTPFVFACVTIEYTVKFSEPKILARST